MRHMKLDLEFRAAAIKAEQGSTKRAVLDSFVHLVEVLGVQEESLKTPERTRKKIALFLEHLQRARLELGARLTIPAFAINVVGEAMARSRLIHEALVEFLKIGLYFHALDQIERRWSSRAAIYTGIHADLLVTFLSRRGLKQLVAQARERLDRRGVFCLTYHYLNALKKAYWERCRASEDALDVAVLSQDQQRLETTEAPRDILAGEGQNLDPADRVQVLLTIFSKGLSGRQQFIYLAKNKGIWNGMVGEEASRSLAELLQDLQGHGATASLNWGEIARKLAINEKTAKREYLRSLEILLRMSARVVFGPEWTPRGYVKRILDQIHSIVREKDLRIKRSTGRTMGSLVRKWEVALRFVLNHERVPA